MEWLLIIAVLFVSLSNGANDNFKGFATVWGSAALSYRQALLFATIATVAGSLASWMLAGTLVEQFSGKGLVPDAITSTPLFILGVASGTAMTVFLATRLGFPVSTTHALIGGLIGASLGQNGGEVHFAKLANAFLLPLLFSPMLAAVLGMLAYRLFCLRPVEKDCVCLITSSPIPVSDGTLVNQFSAPSIVLSPAATCERLDIQARISVSRSLDRLHVLSAMSICFARGVNDTPKLAALLIASHLFDNRVSFALIGIIMAVGGLLFARKVAETMSQRITQIDHAQGLAANLITATLVLFASKFGLPVSTTHVSVGSIAGVGASAKTLNWHALRNVFLSWVATLPLAAVAAWCVVKII
ncbi:MAG: inorganic phosphate transporter [Gallionella sp.]|nr:inorganic phosphate transporter [Gallionella sp.]